MTHPSSRGTRHVDDVDLDDEVGSAAPACEWGMSGWCGQLRQHARCYFNDPAGIEAVRAGTYGRSDGHQWVCPCPCHQAHELPHCPGPHHDEDARERRTVTADHAIQWTLF